MDNIHIESYNSDVFSPGKLAGRLCEEVRIVPFYVLIRNYYRWVSDGHPSTKGLRRML
jgi:hypothetical protein